MPAAILVAHRERQTSIEKAVCREDPVFSVVPKTADILPKSTFDFRANFRPRMDNSFYGAQLECFVYFKSMRNFRLVNDDTFTPPWCLTPMVAG